MIIKLDLMCFCPPLQIACNFHIFMRFQRCRCPDFQLSFCLLMSGIHKYKVFQLEQTHSGFNSAKTESPGKKRNSVTTSEASDPHFLASRIFNQHSVIIRIINLCKPKSSKTQIENIFSALLWIKEASSLGFVLAKEDFPKMFHLTK